MTVPSCSQVTYKTALELLGMLLILIPIGYIYIFTGHIEPYNRGFYCDDKTIKHPYKEETVTLLQAVIIWSSLSIFFLLLVETLRSSAENAGGNRRSSPIPGKASVPWVAAELYRQFGYLLLGGVGCLLFSEIAKYTIGRLRPHFLTLCQPNMSDLLCKDKEFYRYVTESEGDICLGLVTNGGNTTLKQLREARLSFMSGHSTFSFYCSSFLGVYLQAQLSNFPVCTSKWILVTYRILKVGRPFIQMALAVLAFWISLTRVSDYFHHPEDVLTGAFFGVLFSGVTLLGIADVFNRRSAFWKSLNELTPQQAKKDTKSQEDINNCVAVSVKL